MREGSRRRLRHRTECGGPPLLPHDAVDAGGLADAEDSAHILRILDTVQHQYQRGMRRLGDQLVKGEQSRRLHIGRNALVDRTTGGPVQFGYRDPRHRDTPGRGQPLHLRHSGRGGRNPNGAHRARAQRFDHGVHPVDDHAVPWSSTVTSSPGRLAASPRRGRQSPHRDRLRPRLHWSCL